MRGLVTSDPVADWLVCRALLRTAAATPPGRAGPDSDAAARERPGVAPAAAARDVAGCARDVPRLERRIRAMRRRRDRDV